MKNYIVLVLFVVTGLGSSFAQDWQTDFNKAQEMAKSKDLPIILVFQGSDWCAPCIKLDRDVWATNEFKAYKKSIM